MDKEDKKEEETMGLLAPSVNSKAMTDSKKAILSKIMGSYSTKVDLNKLRDLRKNDKK